MISVTKIFEFHSAHFLPNHEGKCKNLHGHTWTLEVTVDGEINLKSGMVVDFSNLKSLVNSQVIERLDHLLLNDIVENPTCENLLAWIWRQLDPLGSWTGKVRLSKLRLWETKDSYAEATR